MIVPTDLANRSADEVTDALITRAEEGLDSSFVGPDLVVSLNTFAPSHRSVAESNHLSRLEGNDYDELCNLAYRAFFTMRKTGQDQAVLVAGESGAGKTDASERVCKLLIDFGLRPNCQRLVNAVLSAQFLVAAFGNVSTASNESSSRLTHYYELQYSPEALIEGYKALQYGFESSRVTSRPLSETNFHVLHWIGKSDHRILSSSHPAARADSIRVEQVRQALRQTGFSRHTIQAIFVVLEAILWLGDLVFVMDPDRDADQATVSNIHVLEHVAGLLQVSPDALGLAFTSQLVKVRGTSCQVFKDAKAAAASRDRTICLLYATLFEWINEKINERLAKDDFGSYVAIVDLASQSAIGDLASLATNMTADRLFYNQFDHLANHGKTEMTAEEPERLGKTTRLDIPNMDSLLSSTHDLVNIVSESEDDKATVAKMQQTWSDHPRFKVLSSGQSFICTHWQTTVTYDTEGFFASNTATMPSGLVELFQSAPTYLDEDSPIPLLRQLVKLRKHDESRLTQTKKSLKRAPSRAKKAQQPPASVKSKLSLLKDAQDSISLLLSSFESTRRWTVLCLRANDSHVPTYFDARLIRRQVQNLQLAPLATLRPDRWLVSMPFADFWERYQAVPQVREDEAQLAPMPYHEKIAFMRQALKLSETQLAIGKTMAFCDFVAFETLEKALAENDPSEQRRLEMQQKVRRSVQVWHAGVVAQNPFSDQHTIAPSGLWSHEISVAGPPSDLASQRPPQTDFAHPIDLKETKDQTLLPKQTIERVKMSSSRKRWVALTWALTFWIPSFLLSWFGRMKRPDVRMAWREKLVINMIIWFICACAVFVIVFLGDLICPKEHVYSAAELSAASFDNDPSNMLVAIRGEIFDLTSFGPTHQPGPAVIPTKSIYKYGGQDVTDLFPVQVSSLCNGVSGAISPWVTVETKNKTVDSNAAYHDFRATTNDFRPDWYYETMTYLRWNFRRGFVGVTSAEVKKRGRAGDTIVIIDGSVFDLTDYIANDGGGLAAPDGQSLPGDIDRDFLSPEMLALFQAKKGTDVTNDFGQLRIGSDVLARQKVCLRNLFFVGKVDTRNSAQCQFSRYILLAISVLMMSVVGFKFFASLQFGRSRKPEDPDKFVICQVPCYTEGEESLRACIESLTRLKYDDKRKIIFIIVDGMVVGSGNDKPTSEIVLDILGVRNRFDQEPLSFLSIGEGAKQHNMGKVYSGLFEASGHVVPYVVVVKCGKPGESRRPGNGGKRDSQMLLLRFLNRVHYDLPMSPLELELFHHMKNIIGVSPSLYEYILQVDADTTVDPYGLNYLVSACVEDKRIIGICGETSLKNAKASWTTMLQVFEYWMSHYLTKAFESLFGGVTCLPGCFSLYRIRSLEGRALVINNAIIEGYGINSVNTLHVKNLLSLGEDRYLTTLMMKTFPNFKLKFRKEAKAQTLAPDDWKVLMSQRRRWINSTVHNLVELLWIDKMCGVCCFSMRFVVFIDLASTVVAPVTVAYIGYLIYLVAAEHKAVPVTALVMLSVVYGLQALVFILHRKFEHIGWMLIYIVAIPLFSFVLPLTSFWRMDDFTWGSTREVVGEKGKRVIVHEEGEFDPASIPLKSWRQYEQELWDAGSNESIGEILAARRRNEPAAPSLHPSMGDYHQQQQQATTRASYFAPRPWSTNFATATSPFAGTPSIAPSQLHRGESADTLAMLLPTGQSPRTPELPAGKLPDDRVLVAVIHTILASSDLEKVTKRDVRTQIESMYEVELDDEQKAFINQVIEQAMGL